MYIKETLHKKMKFSIKDFFLKKSLMENFIFCAMKYVPNECLKVTVQCIPISFCTLTAQCTKRNDCPKKYIVFFIICLF